MVKCFKGIGTRCNEFNRSPTEHIYYATNNEILFMKSSSFWKTYILNEQRSPIFVHVGGLLSHFTRVVFLYKKKTRLSGR